MPVYANGTLIQVDFSHINIQDKRDQALAITLDNQHVVSPSLHQLSHLTKLFSIQIHDLQTD